MACLRLPRELVAIQPRTLSLHLPTVGARLAVVDAEVRDRPGYRVAPGLEATMVWLLDPLTLGLLDGLHRSRGDGVEV